MYQEAACLAPMTTTLNRGRCLSIPGSLGVRFSANDRGLEVAPPVEYKGILVGEAANGLGIVRGHDELTAGLKRFAKS